MFSPMRAVSLLYLLLAVHSAVAYDFSTWLVPVTKLEQLWRYQVGPSGVNHGVTPGDDYICLRDWKGKFIRGSPSGPYNDRTDCRTHERFTVKILGDNLVSLQLYEGSYLTCNKPNAGASSSLVKAAKFILYINENEDKLFLYSPTHGKVFGAYNDNHLLSCSSPNPYASETFYGWKKGPRDAWRAADKWVIVGTYDNRHSKSTATYTYVKTVGLEQSRPVNPDASAAVASEAGGRFSKFFNSRVSTTVGVDWSRESSAAWSTPTTIKDSIEVPPGTATTIYQAVGTYGVFTAESNHFRAEDFDSNGNVLNQRLATSQIDICAEIAGCSIV